MIIINEQYAISSDKDQWMLMKVTNPGSDKPPTWKSFQYHGTLAGALKNLRNRMVRLSDYDSVGELVASFSAVSDLLESKFEPLEKLGL